jgi:hypothetical protein
MNKTDEALKLAKECGATTYTNRHYPDATAVTFSPLAWEKFCEQALAAPVQEPVATVIEELEHDGEGFCAKVRWLYNPVPLGETLSWEQPK